MFDDDELAELLSGGRHDTIPVPADAFAEDLIAYHYSQDKRAIVLSRDTADSWCRDHRGVRHELRRDAGVMAGVVRGAVAIVDDRGETLDTLYPVGWPLERCARYARLDSTARGLSRLQSRRTT